jgi:hypothetical protein
VLPDRLVVAQAPELVCLPVPHPHVQFGAQHDDARAQADEDRLEELVGPVELAVRSCSASRSCSSSLIVWSSSLVDWSSSSVVSSSSTVDWSSSFVVSSSSLVDWSSSYAVSSWRLACSSSSCSRRY